MPTDVKFRSSRVAPPPDECPLTECMSFLGGAWTPNVLWYLREGPRRFNELRRDLVGVSAKVLSQRLQRLQADGIVERRVMPTSPPTVEYELTDLGREILPAVDAIVEVGHRLKDRRAETAKRRPGAARSRPRSPGTQLSRTPEAPGERVPSESGPEVQHA